MAILLCKVHSRTVMVGKHSKETGQLRMVMLLRKEQRQWQAIQVKIDLGATKSRTIFRLQHLVIKTLQQAMADQPTRILVQVDQAIQQQMEEV